MKLLLGLKLQIYGSAHVSWKDSNKESHYDSIVYLNYETLLMEPKDNQNQLTIDAGRHEFDFQFEIPENCPSSFEGHHGYIRYFVRIVFVRPFLNQTKAVPFTVMNTLNLNSTEIDLSVSFNVNLKEFNIVRKI